MDFRIDGSLPLTDFEPSGQKYTTQTGDSWQSVAAAFDTVAGLLAKANGMSMENPLVPGMQLQIPTLAAQVGPAAGLVTAAAVDAIVDPSLNPLLDAAAVGAMGGSSAGDVTFPLFTNHLHQTEEMSCGTTSLAMILNHYGDGITPGEIDREIRRGNVGASPERIVDFARDQGFEAEQYNNGSWDELRSFLDRGIPCMTMIDPDDPGNFNLHYIDVVGYRTEADGSIKLLVQDPGATAGPTEVPLSDFQRQWSNINVGGTENGYNNFFIAVAPKGTDLPGSRIDENAAASALDTAKSDAFNGWDRLTDPDNVGDVPQGLLGMVGSAFGFVGGGIGFGLWKVGDWIDDGTEGIPVLENIAQPLGDFFEGVGSAVADVFNGVNNFVSGVGDAFGSLFDGDVGGFFEDFGGGLYDLAGGVVSAVSDVVSSVADAVSDFFSGW